MTPEEARAEMKRLARGETELSTVTAAELLAREIPPRKLIVSPFLGDGEQCLIFGKRGVGKSWVSLGIAMALAAGGRFLRWEAPEALQVLFIDGEMMARRTRERLEILRQSTALEPGDNLRIYTPDLQPEGSATLNLATTDGRAALERHLAELGPVSLIVADNLSTLFRADGSPNDEEFWSPFQEWILFLRRKGIASVSVAHAGKDVERGPRGSSKLEDALDVSILLDAARREDEDDRSAAFIADFSKVRDFAHGMEKFEARLDPDSGTWTTGSPTGPVAIPDADERRLTEDCGKVLDALEAAGRRGHLPLKKADLPEKLEIHKSRVLAAVRRLVETGRVLETAGKRHMPTVLTLRNEVVLGGSKVVPEPAKAQPVPAPVKVVLSLKGEPPTGNQLSKASEAVPKAEVVPAFREPAKPESSAPPERWSAPCRPFVGDGSMCARCGWEREPGHEPPPEPESHRVEDLDVIFDGDTP